MKQIQVGAMRKSGERDQSSVVSIKDVARCLVATYFIGLGLGILPGIEVGGLFLNILPENIAKYVAGGLVIGLALLVYADIKKRLAALGLAMLAFAASYTAVLTSAGHEQIAQFWRDIALIGLLLITTREARAAVTAAKANNAPKDDNLVIANGATPPAQENVSGSSRPMHPRRVRSELYRQDLDLIRVH